jgi:hypothetical protein
MLPGGHERNGNSNFEFGVKEGYNALKKWAEEKSHEQSWNAVATLGS